MTGCFFVGRKIDDGAYCVETCNQAFERSLQVVEEAVET